MQPALKERNAEVSLHLSFVDGGGKGYAEVYAKAEELEVEFVCIPRPLARSDSPDGGALAYRVAHRVKRWEPGATPRLERTKAEATLTLVV
jgi:alkaline phosphatase D